MTLVAPDVAPVARLRRVTADPGERGPDAISRGMHEAAAGARDDALDAVKGWLVLFMVLYHWLNYFVGLEWSGYRYLRFLTPSFIFIAGFLVSHVYLQRHDAESPVLRRRLIQRGAKLLVLFLALNAVDTLVGARDLGRLVDLWPASRMASVLAFGEGGAAFAILLPIAYFFFVAPVLLALSVRLGVSLASIAAALLSCVVSVSALGFFNMHVELLTIACLGLAAGSAKLGAPERLLAYPGLVVAAYAGYLAAITLWNVPYWLQVVGVCLSAALLYLAGRQWRSPAATVRQVVLLGRYSLLAYVAQIAVLQLLTRLWPPRDLTPVGLAGTLVAATLLTLAAVRATDALRSRSVAADRAYRMVFA
jgi:peptidoglycan/LPS O-acetylase OafA/YrhL